MITFPPEFVTTKFPGYYWNTQTRRLFSIKVTGELRELKHTKASRWTNGISGYRVSVKGRRRWLKDEYLKKLNSQEIPVVYK
jgi:hypothetical protein